MAHLSDAEVQSFRDNGWLVLSGCLGDRELAAMRADMDRVAGEAGSDAPDYSFGSGHLDGARVLRRVEYVIEKSPAARSLLAKVHAAASWIRFNSSLEQRKLPARSTALRTTRPSTCSTRGAPGEPVTSR